MSNDQGYFLKGAVRTLLERAGGSGRASYITRTDQPRLSRYASPNETMHIPIDDVAVLEKDAKDPIVTRALAQLSGYLLIPEPAVGRHPVTISELGALGKETGEALSALSKSLADGKITREEINSLKLRREIREAMTVLTEIDQGLAIIEAGEGE